MFSAPDQSKNRNGDKNGYKEKITERDLDKVIENNKVYF